jgi:hypothetical protein
MPDRPQKITFADMRDMGVRGLLIYCSDYRCSHLITMSGDSWPDDVRLSDLEPRLVCSACGNRGAVEAVMERGASGIAILHFFDRRCATSARLSGNTSGTTNRISVPFVINVKSISQSSLSLPLAFGMYTLLIGSGRYVSCLSASASSPSHRRTPYVSISAKS